MFNDTKIHFFSFIGLLYIMLFFSSCEKRVQNNNEVSLNVTNTFQSNSPNTENISVNKTRIELEDNSDPIELPVISTVEGSHLKIISIAFEAFKTDKEIPEDKKNIEDYKVELRQNKNSFFIFFIAGMAKGEKPSFGGQTILGKDTMFIINKKDFAIKGRTFFK